MPRKPHPTDLYIAEIVARAVEWSAFTQAGGRIVRHFATRDQARDAAQLLADHFRRPALVYAIDPMGRSAVADTVQPDTNTRSTETTMSKTFSKRFNAQRAARAELGGDAQEGTHFRTHKTFGGWTWEPVAAGSSAVRTESPAPKSPKAPAAKRPVTRDAKPAADPSTPARLRAAPLTATPARGKRAALENAARCGRLPDPPDFSKPTHARFRAKLTKLIELAKAGDIAGLKAMEINPISTSPKAMARYRDLCVTALQARRSRAMRRPEPAGRAGASRSST